ncbi:MAG: OadG family protein [Wujia sp.]
MKKKLLILISMLAVMFSLSACSEEKEKPFEYTEEQIVIDTMYLFQQYQNVSDEYADYYISDGTAFESSAVKGIQQAKNNDNVGKFQDFSVYTSGIGKDLSNADYKIEDMADSVSVTVTNHAANRDVEITVKFVENPEYYIKLDQVEKSYNEETIRSDIETYYGSEEEFFAQYGDYYSSIDDIVAQGINSEMEGVYPYLPEEMVVSAVYSKAELMKQAGMNTAIGMGTVFVVLIFISFIISLFKFLPAIFAKKPKIEDLKKEVPKSVPVKKEVPVVKNENLMNDEQLVAVITAAIYAAAGQAGNGAISKDTLVVRSIRRAR